MPSDQLTCRMAVFSSGNDDRAVINAATDGRSRIAGLGFMYINFQRSIKSTVSTISCLAETIPAIMAIIAAHCAHLACLASVEAEEIEIQLASFNTDKALLDSATVFS